MSKTLTYKGAVMSWECDSNGHMNVMHYVSKYEMANKNFMSRLGIDRRLREKRNWGTAAVKQELIYYKEAYPDETKKIDSSLVDLGNKSFTILHELRSCESNELMGSSRVVMVIIDREERSAVPLPLNIRLTMETLLV
jgi:acyl-CoA thioester hydrolase